MFLLKAGKMDGTNSETSKNINMKPLKQFAAEKLSTSPLKEVLLLEDDRLDVHSFLVKLPTWLQLARWAENEGKHYDPR
jgi:hypothetical protein